MVSVLNKYWSVVFVFSMCFLLCSALQHASTASESDLALQSLRSASVLTRSIQTSTVLSSATSGLQQQPLVATPAASAACTEEQVTISEMASVHEADSIGSLSDESADKLQIFEGVVVSIREQLRGTASKLAHLRGQQTSDGGSSPTSSDRQVLAEEGDNEEGSLQAYTLQSDSLSEYQLPSESGRTDEVDQQANTLTQVNCRTLLCPF